MKPEIETVHVFGD